MKENVNELFLSLVSSLAAITWQHLGKIPGPNGKIEKNLQLAKINIDVLLMIKEKTKGNLTDEEERILSTAISDLQLNYVDELKKEK